MIMTKQLRPHGILWDLDNTLYRLDDTIERAINLAVARAAIKLGAEMPMEEAMRFAHQSWLEHRHSAHYFIERYGFTLADMHHETDRMLSGTLVQKCHETRELFGRLEISHALITHAARPWALRTLEHLELRPWFPDAQIFAYEDFEFESKARSTRSFNEALAAISRDAKDSLMVEDTAENLRVPHEMGMTTILLHHGQAKDKYPPYVDFTFSNARELLGVLVAAG
ncbi:MAG: pyrimidine 5-nucleotidase [Micavibrio sp.]|nr:pyrimidine 5-nucleotidase [Micavibrio sp.]